MCEFFYLKEKKIFKRKKIKLDGTYQRFQERYDKITRFFFYRPSQNVSLCNEKEVMPRKLNTNKITPSQTEWNKTTTQVEKFNSFSCWGPPPGGGGVGGGGDPIPTT
jgi:hypothetical protein